MWLWVLSSQSPVFSLSLTCWRASVMEVSGRQLVCQPQTAAHLSLVISSAVFNLAVFFRDPPSLSYMPILILTASWGGGAFVSCCPLAMTSFYSSLYGSVSGGKWKKERKNVSITPMVTFFLSLFLSYMNVVYNIQLNVTFVCVLNQFQSLL